MSTFSKSALEKKIISTWRNALESSKDIEKTMAQSFKYFGTSKGSFFLNQDGINSFNLVLQELKKNSDIARKFSNRYLEVSIRDLIIQLLPVKSKDIVNKVRGKSTQLLNTLSQSEVDWLVMIPITNLELKTRFLDIGIVRFSKFSKNAGKKILSHKKKQARELLRNNVLPKYENVIVGSAHVSAVDTTRARELGATAIKDAIDVLRFYRLNPYFRNINIARNNIDIAGRIHQDKEVALCLRNPPKFDQVTPFFERTGFLFPLTMNSNSLKAIRRDGFNLLSSILKKKENNRTEFERRIISAVHFCALSTYNGSITNSFINSIVSLEAILLKGRETKSGNMAERLALTIGKNLSERNWLFDQMITLYRIRSKIVHAGNTDVTESSLRLLQLINYSCIIKLLKLSKKQKFSTVSDLIHWCKCKKFR